MNNNQSVALYERGKEAWMAWVSERRTEKAELISTELWMLEVSATGEFSGLNQETTKWIEDSMVDLSSHGFQDVVCFDDFEFPAQVSFNEANFHKDVSFDGTKFHSTVDFYQSSFQEKASFRHINFRGWVRFGEVTFHQDVVLEDVSFIKFVSFSPTTFARKARFKEVNFDGGVTFFGSKFTGVRLTDSLLFEDVFFFDMTLFNEIEFQVHTTFTRVHFRENVDFTRSVFDNLIYFYDVNFARDVFFIAVHGKSFFQATRCSFHVVPDFSQANFDEAPSLEKNVFYSDRSYNAPSKWRSLRRLAIQAHDHEREQLFFAEEVKALRGFQTRPFFRQPLRYWLGMCYQVFSNFGRSLLLPFFWWILLTVGSAGYYLDHYLGMLDPPAQIIVYDWKIGSDNDVPFAALKCAGGEGNAAVAALYLAIHNGLVLSGLGGSNKVEQSYACLYGGTPSTPQMPDSVVFIGILQTLLSAILIFLLFLAIRNQFRIK